MPAWLVEQERRQQDERKWAEHERSKHDAQTDKEKTKTDTNTDNKKNKIGGGFWGRTHRKAK